MKENCMLILIKNMFKFPWKENYDKPRQHIKKQRHPFANKQRSIQSKLWFFLVVMYRYES